MPITQRGNSWQATVHFEGKRWRKSLATRQEAIIWEGKTLGAARLGASRPEARTMGELFTLTVENVWQYAKSSRDLIANGQRVIDALHASTPIENIRRSEIDHAVRGWRELGNSNATINRKLAALSRMMSYAVELELIPAVPSIKRLRETEGRLEYWSEELEARVIAHAMPVPMRCYILFSLDTGCRQAEVLRAQWDDFDWLNKTFTVSAESKSGKPRVIPLTDRLLRVLEVLRVSSPARPFMLSPGTIRAHWQQIRASEDDPMLGTPHTMRHTFACRLVQRGAALQRVRDLMGHSSVTVTQRYARLSPVELTETINLLN